MGGSGSSWPGRYPAKKASAQTRGGLGYYFIYRPLGLLLVSPFGRFTLWDPRGALRAGVCVLVCVWFVLSCFCNRLNVRLVADPAVPEAHAAECLVPCCSCWLIAF